MSFFVTKRYGHEEGLSVAFRQWRATHSHCRFLHGYALAFEFTYKCEELDERNWCVDFGNLKELKQWLKNNFDHTTIIAYDDPDRDWFIRAHSQNLVDLRIFPGVSCESFARFAFGHAHSLLCDSPDYPRVKLYSVKVCEHAGNSATYQPEI